jgi:hypothetical protein
MSLSIKLKLQTPTIELVVVAKDASGNSETIKVGFKRYSVEESKIKFKELEQIQSKLTLDTVETEELDNFIKGEIVYIKGASITIEDSATGTERIMSIPDSRTIKPIETLWSDADECKDLLTSAYLTSAPYRVSLLDSMQKAFLNNDYKEASVKN